MEYSDENGLLYMETSAKTAANVNELFVAIGNDWFTHWHHANIEPWKKKIFKYKLAKKLPKTPTVARPVVINPSEDNQTKGRKNNNGGGGGGCCN